MLDANLRNSSFLQYCAILQARTKHDLSLVKFRMLHLVVKVRRIFMKKDDIDSILKRLF